MEKVARQSALDSANAATRSAAQSAPRQDVRIETKHGPVRIVESVAQIDPAIWQNAFAGQFMDSRYYQMVEETIDQGFAYRYAILRNAQTAATAVQPFFFVDQDICAGLPARFRSVVDRVRKRFPRFLTMRIAMVGCVAGEGHLDCAEPWAVEALHEAVAKHARQSGAPIVLFKDVPSKYREPLRAYKERGFTRAPSMPAARMDLDFASFEDFMEKKLGRIYRKNLRRKFRDASRLGALSLEVVNDVTPYIDEVHPLYLQTHHRSELKFEELTKAYFCEVGRRMPERTRFFLWRHEGRIIAFALCLVLGETIYDLNVGMDYPAALDFHMYFITWRDIVTWAIEAKLKHYYTGPLNYDPKLHLKLDLAPLDLYARHMSPLINPIFGLAMRYLQPVRHDPVIQRFANAHEL